MKNAKNSLIFAILMGILPAHAAEKITLRALALDSGLLNQDVYIHCSDSKKAGTKFEIKSYLNHVRQEIEIDSRSLVFTTSEDAASVSDDSLTLGRVSIPVGVESGIVLFLSGAEGRPSTVRLVNDSAKAFPEGAVKVISLIDDEVRITLEKKDFFCAANQDVLIEDQPVQENNSSSMTASIKEGGEWKAFQEAVWPHPGKKRVVGIIHNAGSQILIKTVKDVASPAK